MPSQTQSLPDAKHDKLVTIGCSLAILLVISVIAVSVYKSVNHILFVKWLTQHMDALRIIDETLGNAKEAEIEQFRFANTGKREHLDRSKQLLEKTAHGFHTLRSYLDDSPRQLLSLQRVTGGFEWTILHNYGGTREQEAAAGLDAAAQWLKRRLETATDQISANMVEMRLYESGRLTFQSTKFQQQLVGTDATIFGAGVVLLMVILFLIARREMAERRQAEEQMARNESRVRAIFNNMTDALLICDLSGRIVSTNATAVLTFDCSEDELFGRCVTALFKGCPGQLAPEEFVRRAAQGDFRTASQASVELANGVLPVEFTAVSLQTPEGERVLVALRDISQRLADEKWKRDFVSTISHDLRTPLTSIRGAVDLMLTGVFGTLDQKSAALANIASRHTSALIQLINDLLDLEKLEDGALRMEMIRVNVRVILFDALNKVSDLAAARRVRLTDKVQDVTITADPSRLCQALTGIMTRAIEVTPPEGEVRVICETSHTGMLRINIIDGGSCLPDEYREAIFERLLSHRLEKRKRNGSGLELSLARAIVAAHGGATGAGSAMESLNIDISQHTGDAGANGFAVPGSGGALANGNMTTCGGTTVWIELPLHVEAAQPLLHSLSEVAQ